MEKPTLCDTCDERFSYLIVAWGRELTEKEKRLNQILISESKAEKCTYFGRFFNSNFKKRMTSCEGIEK